MSFSVIFRHNSGFRSVILTSLHLLIFSLIVPHTLTAQVSTTGKITGAVTDSSGAAVPNASVAVKSTALLAPRSTHTEGDGSYQFDLLAPGTYELTVTAAGFRAGVYCSGMAATDGSGIVTAEDIRQSAGKRQTAYWAINDGCPPSPGCAFPPRPS